MITEVQLRLHGIPEAASAAVCQFDTLADAVETVIAVMQLGIPVARIELLDDVQMGACIAYSKLSRVFGGADVVLRVSWDAGGGGGAGAAGRGGGFGVWRAGVCSGRRMPRSGTGCGGRGMMRIGRRWR